MSEHSPLPWKLDKGKDVDGNPQVWHVMDANGNRVITTDCGFYTRFEGDYDLIVNAVNSIDRLRKANEELVFQLDIALKTLGELRQGFEQELSGDTCANIDAIIAKGEKALQSSEECK